MAGLRFTKRFACSVERQQMRADARPHVTDMRIDPHHQIFGGGDVETFLAAEIIGDCLQVDAGRFRELARRSAVETITAEDVEGGG